MKKLNSEQSSLESHSLWLTVWSKSKRKQFIIIIVGTFFKCLPGTIYIAFHGYLRIKSRSSICLTSLKYHIFNKNRQVWFTMVRLFIFYLLFIKRSVRCLLTFFCNFLVGQLRISLSSMAARFKGYCYIYINIVHSMFILCCY